MRRLLALVVALPAQLRADPSIPPSCGLDPIVQREGELLRRELAALGPVSVKVGQTLSQRPDILPEDVCEGLKGLQTSNAPFPDEEAFLVMAEDFNATGPLAPGLPVLDGYDTGAPPLFRARARASHAESGRVLLL